MLDIYKYIYYPVGAVGRLKFVRRPWFEHLCYRLLLSAMVPGATQWRLTVNMYGKWGKYPRTSAVGEVGARWVVSNCFYYIM